MAATIQPVLRVVESAALRRILLATDFAEDSSGAVQRAFAMARRYQSRLYVVHVVHSIGYFLAGGSTAAEAEMQAWRDARRLEVQRTLDGSLEGIQYEVHVLAGPPADMISQAAANLHADLIVLGGHGRHGVAKLLLGSCTEGVLRSAPCPIMTVGPVACGRKLACKTPQRILLLTNFSSASEYAARYSSALAGRSGAELIALHVVEGGEKPDSQQEQAAMQRLRDWLDSLGQCPVTPQTWVRSGPPGETVLEVAHQLSADLIVIGIDRNSGRRSGLSNAYHVVCESECPVVTVPAERERN